jgi:pimeloyl-ACP methyl ester carboxylesterase
MSTIEIDGTAVSYTAVGAGESVVLLHSSACAGGQWRDLQTDLAGRFRAVAPDLYGYGSTGAWRSRKSLRLADEAALVEAVVAQAAPGPVHLVGHSYGGAVALRLALSRRLAVRSLTVIEPVAFQLLRNWDPWGHGLFGEIQSLAEAVTTAVTRGDGDSAMARFVDYWNGPGAWDGLGDRQRAALAAKAAKVAMDFRAVFADPAIIEDFTSVDVPTLILCGGRSPMPARRVAGLLDVAMPNARLTAVPGAGHMLPLTHRDTVNPLIAAHLAKWAVPDRRAA